MDDKLYKLLNAKGEIYLSQTPGLYGGNKKLKIYGKLDCPSALRWIKEGHYIQNRVFFATEEDAIAAGYRPCGVCLPEKYAEWKAKSKAKVKVR
jgi:methylphosphotriester-DNA--protein-cysteine methyltransferase